MKSFNFAFLFLIYSIQTFAQFPVNTRLFANNIPANTGRKDVSLIATQNGGRILTVNFEQNSKTVAQFNCTATAVDEFRKSAEYKCIDEKSSHGQLKIQTYFTSTKPTYVVNFMNLINYDGKPLSELEIYMSDSTDKK